jgi:membrane protein
MNGDRARAAEPGRGRAAERPAQIPPRGWLDILKRTWSEASDDNLGIVAAGVAFLTLLALFPGLSALVAVYGLVADPTDVGRQVSGLSGFLPSEALGILETQLKSLASAGRGSLGFGLVFSVGLALWSAAGGVKAMMTALNIVYDEKERRSFIRFTLTGLGLTAGFILLVPVMMLLVVVVPAIIDLVGLGGLLKGVVDLIRWPLLGAALIVALALLYRFGPSRTRPRWRWVSWGSAAATLMWLLGSVGFSVYIRNFANYDKTYGSLGAGIILLLWLYLGAYVILLGAELNAEMEHQTARDTTQGPDKPLGERQAYVADTVGEAR